MAGTVSQKALQLVRDGSVTRVLEARAYRVRSQSEPDRHYTVLLSPNGNVCVGCPSRQPLCKHIMACLVVENVHLVDPAIVLAAERSNAEPTPMTEDDALAMYRRVTGYGPQIHDDDGEVD